jgi:hypothetical protein
LLSRRAPCSSISLDTGVIARTVLDSAVSDGTFREALLRTLVAHQRSRFVEPGR